MMAQRAALVQHVATRAGFGAVFGFALLACSGALRNATPTTAEVPAPAALPQPEREPPPAEAPPETVRKAVVDSYHGISVSDDYRWLEDARDPAVKEWTAAQNQYARGRLDRLPGRVAIAARVAQVLKAPEVGYAGVVSAAGRWFVLVDQPPKQQPFLVVMPAGGELAASKILLDPNMLDASGKTTIDFCVPSPDGKKVAVSLSKAGTESGDVQVIDVETGASSDAVPRVHGGTAGGDLAWTKDGRGFYYTRYPAPGERPEAELAFYQQLYFHALGTANGSDRYELGRDFPKIAEIRVDVDPRSGDVLVSVQNGDGGQFAHFLKRGKAAYRQLTHFGDGIVHVGFGPGGDLFAVSRRDSPRGVVVRVSGKTLDFGKAKTLYAPEHEAIVTDFWSKTALLFGAQRWYVTLQVGGPSLLRAFDYDGKPLAPIALHDPQRAAGAAEPGTMEVAAVRAVKQDGEGHVLVRAGSFTEPSAWYRYDEASGKAQRTALANGAPIDLSAIKVVRELAISKDGTQVPVNILLPEGVQLDGSRACVVNGYGGYGISIDPRYSSEAGLWLEHGVIFAVANLRGGGEFGESWHHQGNLEHKQNVFDDFAAVLHHLHARGYCRPARTGIIGGSNGGLLMGATLVQHPELVRAAVSFVGIYDMLRSELGPNGEFNVTEFGTVKDPVQFKALYAYSPFHNVVDGTPYPRALLLTGENDPRVEPWQSRKMIARLQASGAGGPYLLRTSADAGHGGGTDLDEIVAQTTDAVGFMLDALGVVVR